MTEPQPFDSTHVSKTGDGGRRTWYQELARQHAAHPGWSTAQHIKALNETLEGDMSTLAALYGITPEAMIAEGLEAAS
jgi:hypothetical protein